MPETSVVPVDSGANASKSAEEIEAELQAWAAREAAKLHETPATEKETKLRQTSGDYRRLAEAVGLSSNHDKYRLPPEFVEAQNQESNLALMQTALRHLTFQERLRGLSKYPVVNAVSRVRVQELSRLSSSSFLVSWSKAHLQEHFAPDVPKMWQAETKPVMESVTDPATGESQEILVQKEVLNQKINSDASSFVQAHRIQESSREGEPGDTITTEKLRNVNPYYVVAELALQSLKVLYGARHQAMYTDHPEMGVTQVALPERPEYYIIIHANGQFCKLKIAAELLKDNDASRVYESLINQLHRDPVEQRAVWHDFDTTGKQEKAFRGKVTTQDVYQPSPQNPNGPSPREDLSDPTAADLVFVLTDPTRTSLNWTQHAYTSLTYGPSIPLTYRLGLVKTGSEYAVKTISTKASHIHHDGAVVRKMLNHILPNTLKRVIARKSEYSDRQQDFNTIDPLNNGLDTRELTNAEADVMEVTVPIDQKRINKIHQQAKVESAVDVPQHEKKLDQRTLHNFLTLAIMAAGNHQDAHFVEAELRHHGLSPAIVTMPKFLIRALTREDGRGLTPREERVLKVCLQAMSERRDECRKSRGIPQVLAVCSGGLINPNKRFLVEKLGKYFDKFRARLVTNTTTISMPISGRGDDYSHEGVINDGFTSARDDTHEDTYGCDWVDQGQLKITYRNEKKSHAKQPAEFESRLTTALGKILDVFDSPDT